MILRSMAVGFVLLSFSFFALGVEIKGGAVDQEGIAKLSRSVEVLSNEVKEIRRDQLNYKIEKDLLKEAYSSNLGSINLVITLILGTFTVVFSVIGFLGLRSIEAVRREFKEELEKLRGVRAVFEEKLPEIDKKLEVADKGLAEINQVNKEQDKRLQLLEIQERSISLHRQGDYRRALEYIALGLEISSDDPILNNTKSLCLMRLGDLMEASVAIEKVLEKEPENYPNISNLVEMYFVTGRREMALGLIESKRDGLVGFRGDYILWYFEALNLFILDDVVGLKKLLRNQPSPSPVDLGERIRGWEFSEVSPFLEAMRGNSSHSLMCVLISFLEGKTSVADLSAAVDS